MATLKSITCDNVTIHPFELVFHAKVEFTESEVDTPEVARYRLFLGLWDRDESGIDGNLRAELKAAGPAWAGQDNDDLVGSATVSVRPSTSGHSVKSGTVRLTDTTVSSRTYTFKFAWPIPTGGDQSDSVNNQFEMFVTGIVLPDADTKMVKSAEMNTYA